MKFRFIFENRGIYGLEKMCKILEVSRSGYHKYVNRKMSIRKLENIYLLEQIKKIHEKSHSIYGSRKIRVELRAMGINCNRKRISRIMRENGIYSKTKRRFKVTTKSKHNKPVAENLVNRNFKVEEANKIWVSDITYIWTSQGWLYLAVVLDLYSRMVVGWSLSQRINCGLVKQAIMQALTNRRVEEGLIFHSDRGSQYASKEVVKILEAHKSKQSMSGKGNCYDNSVAESFFHTLKTELIYFASYSTIEEARSCIFDYIEIFYNRQRRHSTLNYFSPIEFENRLIKKVA